MKKQTLKLAAMILLCTSLVEFSAAQPIQNTWTNAYSGTGGGYNTITGANVISGKSGVTVAGISSGIGEGFNGTAIRYDGSGGVKWTATYNNAGVNGDDGFLASKFIEGDSLLVTAGYSTIQDNGLHTAWLLVKYSASGSKLWKKTFSGDFKGQDSAFAVADDGSNIYVCGKVQMTSTTWQPVVIKYNSSGAKQWTKYFTSCCFATQKAAFTKIIIDDGMLMVAGEQVNENGDSEGILAQYDLPGNLQWSKTFSGTGQGRNIISSITCSAVNENVVIAGKTWNGLNYDIFVNSYSEANGTLSWSRTIDGLLGEDDEAVAMEIEGKKLMIAGNTGSGANSDVIIMTLETTSGATQGQRQYDLGSNDADLVAGFQCDALVAMWIGGTTIENGEHKPFVIVLDEDNGTLLSKSIVSDGAGHDEIVTAVAYETGDRIYVGGNNLFVPDCIFETRMFEGYISGNDVSLNTVRNYVNEPQVIGKEVAVVNGSTYSLGENGSPMNAIVLVKYDEQGNQSWVFKQEISNANYISGMKVNDNGTAFISVNVTNGNGTDEKVYQVSSQGTLNWSKTINENTNDFTRGMVIDAAGDCFIITQSLDVEPSTCKIFYRRYNPNGKQSWKKSVGKNGINASDLVMDASSNLYLAASWNPDPTNSKLYLRQINSTTGVANWTKQRDVTGFLLETGKIVFDQPAPINFYVSANQKNVQSNLDSVAAIFKYSTAGDFQWKKTYSTAGKNAEIRSMIVVAVFVSLVGSNGISGTNEKEIFIRNYDSNGNLLAHVEFGGQSSNYNDEIFPVEPIDAFCDASGALHVLYGQEPWGGLWLDKYNSDLTIAWQMDFKSWYGSTIINDIPAALAYSADGTLAIVGSEVNGLAARTDMITLRYSLPSEFRLSNEDENESENEMNLQNSIGTNSEVVLYPNPAASYITIKSNTPVQEIRVYDLNGKLIRQLRGNETQYSLDVNELVPGIYFLSALTEKDIVQVRFVKQ
ncbi:MAG TPA: T9SS type A sorting domain-containing protein [Chitinophagales bacterium]|nr:T9SS type A sorting domain-containing protein [Chitinophagales bacterium]